ncbi:MAG: hypothetical protein KKD17_04620 [Nanoarchaeota archaeon]|nr:hypothetical protein [Nanoarchaeota archaeon]
MGRRMKIEEVARMLEGMHTIESVAEDMKIKKTTAANLVCRLRKHGYVQTTGGRQRKRVYYISPIKEVKGEADMFNIINRHSRMKIAKPYNHLAYGDYTTENALIDAILTRSLRTILASLNLYNHLKDWKKLHTLARKKGIEQEVGALYDTARTVIKTRRMPENIRKSMKKNKKKEIIPHLSSRSENIRKIEKEWKVSIPFNQADLEEIR